MWVVIADFCGVRLVTLMCIMCFIAYCRGGGREGGSLCNWANWKCVANEEGVRNFDSIGYVLDMTS